MVRFRYKQQSLGRRYKMEDVVRVRLTTDQFTASIVEIVAGLQDLKGYWLMWGDGVANDWVEHFDTMPLALARLAVIDHSTKSEKGFIDPADEFAIKANAFLEGSVK
jgi:hypothetical protein